MEYAVAILAVIQAYALWEGYQLRKYTHQFHDSYSHLLGSQTLLLKVVERHENRIDKLDGGVS